MKNTGTMQHARLLSVFQTVLKIGIKNIKVPATLPVLTSVTAGSRKERLTLRILVTTI